MNKSASGASRTALPDTKDLAMQDWWKRVCKRLRAELGDAKFDSWFGRVELEGIHAGVVYLSVPTTFLKSWIQRHFLENIRSAIAADRADFVEVVIRIRSSIRATAACERDESRASKPATSKSVDVANSSANATIKRGGRMEEVGDGQRFIGSPLDQRMTFETFLVGPSNAMPHKAAMRVASSSPGDHVEYNPLYVHANVGLGKTHLVQSIAQSVASNGRNVLYLTAEKFMYGFASSLKTQTTLAFKDQIRAIDLLIVDDVQFLNGKVIPHEFGHVLNSMLDSGRQVVVAADRQPSELDNLDERVRSRLMGGVSLELGPLDIELRRAILASRISIAKQRQPGFEVPATVVDYVAQAIDSNGRDLEGAVNRLLARVTLSGAPLTIEVAETAIRDLIRTRDPKKVKIEDIQKLVASHYNVTRADLLSSRRTASVVRPRQIAMFLSKVLTPRSLPEIGRRFGGRDHTTVLHAVRKIEGLSATDRGLAQDIDYLKRMLTEI
ncbi:MAG: chromosomal replication initiator protein DnaA [Rhodoblastus sp.]|nr:chromosomal replication initiator protein DnaA [Rhodoblastus sp.]